jgi:hypothetical protein
MSPVDRYDRLIAFEEVRLTRIRMVIARLQPEAFTVRRICVIEAFHAHSNALERRISQLEAERRIALRNAAR